MSLLPISLTQMTMPTVTRRTLLLWKVNSTRIPTVLFREARWRSYWQRLVLPIETSMWRTWSIISSISMMRLVLSLSLTALPIPYIHCWLMVLAVWMVQRTMLLIILAASVDSSRILCSYCQLRRKVLVLMVSSLISSAISVRRNGA